MNITIGEKLRVTNPSAKMMMWVQANLTLDNPEYIRRTRMGKWTGQTPQKLYLYEVDGGALVIPFGCLAHVLTMLTADDTMHSVFPADPIRVDYGEGEMNLYDYQQKALEKVANAKFGILQSPAGSGKTQIGIALIKKLGRRTLWVTHTADLLKQSKERAFRYIDKSLIGTITAGKVEIGAGVTFATVQTLVHLDLSQYRNTWDVIIVDECHRVSGTPTVLTMFSKVLNSLAARHKYGLSATVHRADGMIKATYALLGPVVHEVPQEAVADKIMRVTVHTVGTGVGMSPDCLSSDGMLDYAKLIDYLCNNEERNRMIAELMTAEPTESFLILSDRLEHLAQLESMLPDVIRNEAAMISGKMVSKTAKAEREAVIEQMRTGEKRILFATYALAKEGLDIPRLSRLIMATPQADYAVITQSIGRIARIFDGKSSPICYDLVDNMPYLIKRYKHRCTSYRKAGCHIE